MKDEPCLVSTSIDSKQLASALCKTILNQRLAACGQIIPEVESMYWWYDKLETEAEVIVQFKSHMGLVKKLMQTIKAEHSYDVPEIIVTKIDIIDVNYGEWLKTVTTKHF